MTPRTKTHRRLFKTGVTLGAVGLWAGTLASCSAGGTTRAVAGAGTAAPSFPTPLATSVQTAAGTWATIAMGHLGQPLNTFWQLFFQPPGATSWSNQVEATATATNGGLVLASAGDRSVIVGVRPSVRLSFTPLIATSNGPVRGRTGSSPPSWRPVPPPWLPAPPARRWRWSTSMTAPTCWPARETLARGGHW